MHGLHAFVFQFVRSVAERDLGSLREELGEPDEVEVGGLRIRVLVRHKLAPELVQLGLPVAALVQFAPEEAWIFGGLRSLVARLSFLLKHSCVDVLASEVHRKVLLG